MNPGSNVTPNEGSTEQGKGNPIFFLHSFVDKLYNYFISVEAVAHPTSSDPRSSENQASVEVKCIH
jgi:hypothetical protein